MKQQPIPKSRPVGQVVVSDDEILAAAYRAAGNSLVGELLDAAVFRELGGRISMGRLGDRRRQLTAEGRWLWDKHESGPRLSEEQLRERIAKVKAESLERLRLGRRCPKLDNRPRAIVRGRLRVSKRSALAD